MININDYRMITDKTKQFINNDLNQDSFYIDLLSLLKSGNPEIKLHRRILKRKIELDWVCAIEDSLDSLDIATRNPSKYIEEREEVKPIELSRNITSRSIRHLAQHSDFINKFDHGEITPSKILNCYNEETLQTYENKFVNTLIQRLYLFVSKRYTEMKASGKEDSCDFDFNSEFDDGKYKGKIRFGVSVSKQAGGNNKSDDNDYSIMERVERLNSVVITYLNCDFVKNMGDSFIRPPVIRTNAITKNKDLKQLLTLWEFIESYEKIGYTISVEESAQKPDEEFIDDLYQTMAVQYAVFRYNLTHDSETLESSQTKEEIEPKFITELVEVQQDDFDLFDTEYKKVIPVSLLNSRRKLTDGEMKIREAISFALEADKAIEAKNKKVSSSKNTKKRNQKIKLPKVSVQPENKNSVFEQHIEHTIQIEKPKTEDRIILEPIDESLSEQAKRRIQAQRDSIAEIDAMLSNK